jgi:hypothetical protein
MSRLLKTILLILALTIVKGQKPDDTKYDTLYTRSNKMILMPRYDSIRELKEINAKADTILSDLQLIKCTLNIQDTTKYKRR